jgi:DNA-binding SARP family transcriptional activator
MIEPEGLVMPASPAPHGLQLLGLPRVVRASAADHVLERRDAALLALLVLNGPTPRGQVAALLWPDVVPKLAQANLRQRLFRLKRAIGAELVISDTTRLQLLTGLLHDLQASQILDPAQQREHALLGGCDYSDCGPLNEWVEQARAQWQAQRRSSWANHAEALEADGRLAEALLWAQRLARDEAGSEHAHRRVMRLHYLRGDRAAALEAFTLCVGKLQQEAGANPSAETLALAALIERSGSLPATYHQPAAPATALKRPPLLIGREAEWQQLVDAQQRGCRVLLSGEAGIGKTRLAEDFASSLGPAEWLKAQIGDRATPYALLTRWMQQLLHRLPLPPEWARVELACLLPAFGEPAPGRLSPLRLQQSLEAWLAPWSDEQMGSLVLDDLQWADDASLDALLAWLSARPQPWALLLLRTGAEPTALQAWREARLPGQLQEVRLGPLPSAALPAFLQSLQLPPAPGDEAQGRDLPAWLLRRTGGRPLFMLELLRAAAHQRPSAEEPALMDMIETRLRSLSALALRLARVAALMGPTFSLGLVAEVLRLHPVDLADPWLELQAAQLMDEAGWAFDLAQETALRSLPVAVASLLHAEIAAVFERQGMAPSVVASHWQLAGAWRAAALQYEHAAALALKASRRVEELGFLDAALQAYEHEHSQAQAFRVAHQALSASMAVETPGATEARVQALQAAASSDAQRLQALLAASRQRLCLSDGAGALEPSRQALALAQSLGHAEQQAVAAGWHGLALALVQRNAEGLHLFEAALPTVEGFSEARAQLDFYGAYGYALHCAARYREALGPLRRAAALAERLGDLAEAMDQHCNVAVCLNTLGEQEQALLTHEAVLALWRRMGEPPGMTATTNHLHLATAFFALGRYREALELLPWALAQFRQGDAPVWVVIAENRLARVHLRLGQYARARQGLSAVPAGADAGNRAARQVILGRLDMLAGKLVLPGLLQAHAALPEQLDLLDRCSFELLIAALQPPEEALIWCERLQGRVSADHVPVLIHAGARRADALRRLGRHSEARAQALSALALAERGSPLDMDPAELWWLLFLALRDGGAAAAAAQALTRGCAWIEQARPHVPDSFVSSFLERNPFNAALLAEHRRVAVF